MNQQTIPGHDVERQCHARPKNIEWIQIGFWIPVGIWFSVLFTLTITLGVWGALPAPGSACKPDGTFSPFSDDYTWWSRASFFEITLKTSQMSFAEVKVIDLIWDLVIGRAGQALLAWVSWKVFASYVAVMIQKRPTTYSAYFTIFVKQETSFTTIYRLIRELGPQNILGSKAVMVFVIFTLNFILAFPTMASAMTGYAASVEAFIQDRNSEGYIKYSTFELVEYVVHDGHRIGLTKNYIMSYRAPENVRQYGFFGRLNSNTTWGDWDEQLPAPALDISAFYLPPMAGNPLGDSAITGPYGYDWHDPLTKDYPFRNKSKTTFAFDNKTFTLDYILENGTCQPISEVGVLVIFTYQWGFSYLQLYIAVNLLLLWSAGIYLLWLKARFNLPLAQHDQVPQEWECVLHMSRELRRELKRSGIKSTKRLTDPQLKQNVMAHLQGGQISFGADLETDMIITLRMGVWRWLGINRLWACAFALQMLSVIASLLLHLLWRESPSLLALAYVSCFLVCCVLLTKGTKFLIVILPLAWLGIGLEFSRLVSLG
ncbi:hypothetical protein B0T21DRAFT_280580 [Apiosordaria backusii]|uniref:Uncharacterized protein n=1 Tax=Apiosordaria backusii TaxID=314023 RepID=A0AA40ESA0_9PEZI|nr:hypothetical protein B0T21DRAFT_280580 [Apiosordaria backusii]